MRASSRALSEYSSLRPRNSRTIGSFISSSAVSWSSGMDRWALLISAALSRESAGALIELSCDLTVELPDRPSSPQRFSFIKDPRLFALHSKQADVVRPWQGKSLKPRFLMFTRKSRQCLELWGVHRYGLGYFERILCRTSL